VVAVTVVLGTGLIVRLLDEAGVPLVRNLPGIAFWVVPLLGIFELRRLLRTLTIVSRRRQRRIEYRMPIDTPVVAMANGGVEIHGWTRDLCPSGLGLEVLTPLPAGTVIDATFELPALSGRPPSVALALVAQTCRPLALGTSWAIGTRIAAADDETARRIIEYCYVVCQVERLRTGRQLALPAPALVEVPARVLVPSAGAVAA
jgi:hypothetical protein